MVQIRFSPCLVWVLSASVYFPSSLVLSARILAPEKYPARHDKHWWYWNQEAKDKPGMLVANQKKGEKEIKLEFKRSVHPLTPDVGLLSSILSKEPLTHHMNRKRWLTGTFGFCGKKKVVKESRKWQTDSQQSGSDTLSTARVIGDYKTGVPLQKSSAGSRPKALRKHNKKISLHHNPNEHRAVMNVDNVLFGSSIHACNKENNLNSAAHRSQQRLPEQSMLKYSYHRPLPASVQVWNKSDDPVWELKLNPLKRPYPFHDMHSSNIKLSDYQTTPRLDSFKTLEPLKELRVQNDHQLSSSAENENGALYELMESKGVAKSKKPKQLAEQRHRDYELLPKTYALNKLGNVKNRFHKDKNHYGLFANSARNPIIVPGFKHKQTDVAQTQAPHDEQVFLPSYVIHTEERNNPYKEEFIQVSRANRNHSKNMLGENNVRQVTAGNIPIQMPSPYAFPGGVNISILVPNPPALSSHETPLSTMTSTSSDKYNKRKKERKHKVKSNEELHTNILSEPRSLVSATVDVKQLPYARKTINPLTGDDGRRMGPVNLTNYRPQLKGTMGNIENPMFNLKTQNFSLLSHIRNLTMNQLGWDAPLLGIETETGKKATDYPEADDDDDDIRMLYDEHTPATTTLQSDEKEQTVSFSWYRLTDYTPRTFSLKNAWMIGKLSTPRNIKTIPRLESSSSRVKPRMEYDEYPIKQDSRHINYTGTGDERTFKRSARDEMRKSDLDGGNTLKKCGMTLNVVKHETYIENEHLMGQKDHHDGPKDQWDALDEDLESEISVNNGNDVAWQAKNRKREIDYDEHQANDEQGYYRLSAGESSLKNPSNFIMSKLRLKSNQPREREYYDDIPEERTREQMRRSDVVPSTYPK